MQLDVARNQAAAAFLGRSNGYDEGYNQILATYSAGSPRVNAIIIGAAENAVKLGLPFVVPDNYATLELFAVVPGNVLNRPSP